RRSARYRRHRFRRRLHCPAQRRSAQVRKTMTTLRLLVSRHSAFYSPLIATLAAGFLRTPGLDATYQVLPKGRHARDMTRNGEVDIVQAAVSSNWGPLEKGETDLPVHFAQINQRDGFFLAARAPGLFHWKQLEGATLLVDHAAQPLAMLRY